MPAGRDNALHVVGVGDGDIGEEIRRAELRPRLSFRRRLDECAGDFDPEFFVKPT
jgi:hypothetical protein